MRALIQRVSEASVTVGDETLGAIGQGLLVLFCAEEGDDAGDVELMARKTANLRIFEDEAGKMNRSVLDIGGAVLAVSQFTLSGDSRKGNRPSFIRAAAPEAANTAYEAYCAALRAMEVPVETGRFAAEMKVALVNDGPVTIWLDTAELRGMRG
ncbi:MAG: D-tyrosyl-tRNA(Tyr) deacylase [Rhodospirillales bacterium]|nr:MAG: D-tyrosyl-tRNA(Tyr) deacylase [Rhodospirillales bacterium]